MNARIADVLYVVALVAVLVIGFAGGRWSTAGTIRDLTAKAASAEATVALQSASLEAISKASAERAHAAEKAVALAREVSKADRAEATRLIGLRVPEGADACTTASALVDSIIQGERRDPANP